MSSLGKLRKNAENYKINQFYKNMTPEQHREAVRYAIENTKNSERREFDARIKRLKEDLDNQLIIMIDMISIEFIYELANQLGCFEKVPEYLDEKVDKVQDIYSNAVESIQKYVKYKRTSQVIKDFEKKKRKVENIINIKF